MRIEKEDFVALRSSEGKKKLLAQVVAYDAATGEYVAVIDDTGRAMKETQETLRFTMDDVVCNFGPDPELGSAYSLKVEPFRTSFTMKPWGTVFVFRQMNDIETQVLKRGLAEVGAWMQKNNLDRFLPIEVQIRPPRGRFAGWYKVSRKEEVLSQIILHPKAIENMRYVLLHEFGHHIWHWMFPQSLKARWVHLYHQGVSLDEVKTEQIASMLKDFQGAGMTLKEFRADLDEEKGQPLFDEVTSYIYSYHNLTVRHLQLLLDENFDISSMWPKSSLELSSMDLGISDYAMKSPEEYWPEAFAFALSGLEVPERLRLEVQNSLRVARGERVVFPRLAPLAA